MHWPPKVGELLPRAADTYGVREKLLGYSLDATHKDGGPKARGFERILGITVDDVEYLANAIEEGILAIAISDVRDNTPYGVTCEVLVPIRGLGDRGERVVTVITAWELTGSDHAPRLVNAYIGD